MALHYCLRREGRRTRGGDDAMVVAACVGKECGGD